LCYVALMCWLACGMLFVGLVVGVLGFQAVS